MISTTSQKVHTSFVSPENISILLVSPSAEDMSSLRRILHHGDWHISRASDCQEAAKHLRQHGASVVICDRDLPDGDWKDLLQQTSAMDSRPLLLVVSRVADEALWAEVLNLGGYDVLLKPFDRSEVLRVIGMAWRQWWASSIRRKPGSESAIVNVQYA